MRYLSGALGVRVFLCFAAAYLLSYAFRSISAVIAPGLVEDVGLSNADLGLLSSAYFLSFAALQLPLGIWLDKYGARRTEAALLLIAAVGAAIFAASSSMIGLLVGRALIGIGVSGCLMAAYKAYRQWYAPGRQAQLASWMLMAGTSGALIATVPVSAALPYVGWRGVFWVMSGMVLLIAAAIFFSLRKVEADHAAAQPTAATSTAVAGGRQGYRLIFGNPYFRRAALLMVNHGSFVAFQTLWAGPWLMTVLGMSKQRAAEVLFLMNFALLLAYFGLSWIATRYVSHDGSRGWTTTRVIATGLSMAIVAQAFILAIPSQWTWVFWILFALFVPVATLAQTSVSLSFPSALAGRANSAFNLMLFIGAFVMQWGLGLLIDAFEKYGLVPADAMRAALAVCIAGQVASLTAFALNRAQPDKM